MVFNRFLFPYIDQTFVTRSPHHFDPSPDIVVNGSMFMYPSQPAKREYYDQYRLVNCQEPCTSTSLPVEGKTTSCTGVICKKNPLKEELSASFSYT